MPTLKERMNQKRSDAIKASNQQTAEYIWSLIEKIFDTYAGYQLECWDYISVTVTEKVDYLKLDVTIKECNVSYEDTTEYRHIALAYEKLEKISSIMLLVRKLAENEGVLVWNVLSDEFEDSWGFHMALNEEAEE